MPLCCDATDGTTRPFYNNLNGADCNDPNAGPYGTAGYAKVYWGEGIHEDACCVQDINDPCCP